MAERGYKTDYQPSGDEMRKIRGDIFKIAYDDIENGVVSKDRVVTVRVASAHPKTVSELKITVPILELHFSPGGKSHQRASPSCCSSRFRTAVIIVESMKTDFGSP